MSVKVGVGVYDREDAKKQRFLEGEAPAEPRKVERVFYRERTQGTQKRAGMVFKVRSPAFRRSGADEPLKFEPRIYTNIYGVDLRLFAFICGSKYGSGAVFFEPPASLEQLCLRG